MVEISRASARLQSLKMFGNMETNQDKENTNNSIHTSNSNISVYSFKTVNIEEDIEEFIREFWETSVLVYFKFKIGRLITW